MTEAFEQAKREFADKWRRMTHSIILCKECAENTEL